MKTLTEADHHALQVFAEQEGRVWKAKLRRMWREHPKRLTPEEQVLMRLRNTWGLRELERYHLPPEAPQKVPPLVHEDVRRHVLEDLAAGVDRRGEDQRQALALLAVARALALGYHPGPHLDRGQMLWIRCYLHLAHALMEPAVL